MDPDRESSGNVEGAPTLVYELWSWHPEHGWLFVRYATLTLRKVLNYQSFGYHVERSRSDDRRDLVPLFPRLDPTGQDERDRMD